MAIPTSPNEKPGDLNVKHWICEIKFGVLGSSNFQQQCLPFLSHTLYNTLHKYLRCSPVENTIMVAITIPAISADTTSNTTFIELPPKQDECFLTSAAVSTSPFICKKQKQVYLLRLAIRQNMIWLWYQFINSIYKHVSWYNPGLEPQRMT